MSYNFLAVTSDGEVVDTRQRRGPTARILVSHRFNPDEPSRTKQADMKSADINNIVARYKKTGELPVVKRAPLFEEMNSLDYKYSLDILTAAQQSFALLPAHVRNSFDNDPARLLHALDNSSDPHVHETLFRAGVFAEPYKAPEKPLKAPSKEGSAKGAKSSKQPDLPLGKKAE